MDGVPWKNLRQMMQKLNPRVRWELNEKKALAAMVYLHLPKHPDADPQTGLWEIAALPNPYWFPITPRVDTSKVDPNTGKEHWVRGYSSFFKGLLRTKDPASGRPLFDRAAVKSLNIGAYAMFNSAKFRRDLNERNKTDVEKWNDKNKGMFRPVYGEKPPVGWKPKLIVG